LGVLPLTKLNILEKIKTLASLGHKGKEKRRVEGKRAKENRAKKPAH
jgi:hypothetical protein